MKEGYLKKKQNQGKKEKKVDYLIKMNPYKLAFD